MAIGTDTVETAVNTAPPVSSTAKVATAATLAGAATSLFTGKFFVGFAVGVVIGAVGYKIVSDKTIRRGEISKTFADLADTLDNSDE